MKKLISVILSATLLMTMTVHAMASNDSISADNQADIINETTPSESSEKNAEERAASNKAIVVIPGVGGSVLRNSSGQACWLWATTNRLNQIACTSTGASVNTITAGTGDYGVLDYYKPLCNMLEDYYGDEYDIVFFPYDWRMSNTTSAAKLAIAINNTYDEVILVAHSMGGLVASKYLANSSINRNKVDKLITLGTPYTGTPHLIYVAETGDFNFILSSIHLDDDIKELVKNFHCTYQLAPTARYNNNYGNYIKYDNIYYSGENARAFYSTRPWAIDESLPDIVKPMFSAATTFHNGLMVSGTHIANGSLVDTYKIVGTGEDTASMIYYYTNNNYNCEYLDVDVNNSGDGTVPLYSASNTQATTASRVYTVANVSHMDLIKDEDVFSRIRAIIDGSSAYLLTNGQDLEAVEVNEKGWIVGADNKRIYIIVDSNSELSITDGNEDTLTIDPSGVYNANGDKVGSIWKIGGNRTKYVMRDDNYSIQVNMSSAEKPALTIEYQNNGYYTHSETYSDIVDPCINVNISEFAGQAVTMTAMSDENMSARTVEIIQPTHTMTAEELAARNA